MKKTSLFVNAILALAIVVLYVLHFGSANKGNIGTSESKQPNKTGNGLKVAYLKMDSLLLNYELALDLHDEFTKKQAAYNNEFGEKRNEFEKQALAFKDKLQRGGFLTQERAIQERDRLAGQEKEIQKLDMELSGKLAEIQQQNNQQLFDSINNYLKVYNETQNYTYIVNGSSVLIGEEGLNITGEVLKALNDRYESIAEKSGEKK